MKIRRVISLTLFISFIVLSITGVMLFIGPQGRVARWAGWEMFGLTKDQYGTVHTTFMVLFLTAAIWHLVLNWRAVSGYLKDRSKQLRIFTPESSVALGLSVIFFVGPLLELPPFKQFLDAGSVIHSYWESVEAYPAWGHAESNTLERFCRMMEDSERLESQRQVVIDCAEALAALQEGGMKVDGMDQRLIDIARANETTPVVLAEIILGVAKPGIREEVVRLIP